MLSLSVTLMGVFTLPVLDLIGGLAAARLFGLAVLLLVAYAFALAGHYAMYNRRTKRSMSYFPLQERAASPARHAATTCAALMSSGPSEISCAGGIALAACGCLAKSSSVRSGRRWKTRCSPLLILYRTEGSHEALSLPA